ncbi:MAG: LysE family transporter [Flavobacteriaceae bacterium]
MAYLLLFAITFFAAVLATLPPGLLNMNAVKIRVTNGKRAALFFILGVIAVVAIEAWAAAVFSKFVYQNPEVQRRFLWVGIFVFSVLALYFFRAAYRTVHTLRTQRNFFTRGLVLALLNVLNIPFYALLHALLRNASLVRLAPSETLVFASAALGGTFSVLYGYSYGSSKIAFDERHFQRRSNRTIAFVMLILVFISFIRLISSYA